MSHEHVASSTLPNMQAVAYASSRGVAIAINEGQSNSASGDHAWNAPAMYQSYMGYGREGSGKSASTGAPRAAAHDVRGGSTPNGPGDGRFAGTSRSN